MVFADSSGFIAAFDRRDENHAAAARAWRSIAKANEGLVTTSLVFAETVTFLRRRGGFAAARRAGEAILASRAITLVHPAAEQARSAWSEFLRNPHPRLSFCDAVSFVVMRERAIRRAFTFDRDFRDAGFELVVDA